MGSVPGREQAHSELRTLAHWALVSLIVLGGAVLASLSALLVYGRLNYAARVEGGRVIVPSGISASEFVEIYAPQVAEAGFVGLLALVLTTLYWLVGIRLFSGSLGPARQYLMRLSLVLVPLTSALAYAWLTFSRSAFP